MVHDGVLTRRYPFEPRSDDGENVWEVHEITQESDAQYKVRWAGIDPQTGKPWAQSWVPKYDCTDEAIEEWEAKKKHVGQNGAFLFDADGEIYVESSCFQRCGWREGRAQAKAKAAAQRRTKSTEVLDEASANTVKAQPGKKQKQEESEEDEEEEALTNATRFDAHSSLKVGPPRGVRKKCPANSRSHTPGSSPVVRSSGRGAEPSFSMGKGPANCPSKQMLSAPDDKSSTKAAEERPGKMRKQESDEENEEKAPIDATCFDAHFSLKVGPPRGMRKRRPANLQPLPPGPSPAARLSGECVEVTMKTGDASANCSLKKELSAPERQSSCLSGLSEDPKAWPNWGSVAASASKPSSTSGEHGLGDKALEGSRVQFTRIAANILTLHGLVKKVDVQLAEAMKELSESRRTIYRYEGQVQ